MIGAEPLILAIPFDVEVAAAPVVICILNVLLLAIQQASLRTAAALRRDVGNNKQGEAQANQALGQETAVNLQHRSHGRTSFSGAGTAGKWGLTWGGLMVTPLRYDRRQFSSLFELKRRPSPFANLHDVNGLCVSFLSAHSWIPQGE
jgi:hypothetical protein